MTVDALSGDVHSGLWGNLVPDVSTALMTLLARLVDHGMVATPNQAYGFTADGLPPSSTNKPVFSASPVISAVRLSSTTRDLSIYEGTGVSRVDLAAAQAGIGDRRFDVHPPGLPVSLHASAAQFAAALRRAFAERSITVAAP